MATGSTAAEGELILQFSGNSNRWSYSLTMDESLYLDNKKWFRGTNKACN